MTFYVDCILCWFNWNSRKVWLVVESVTSAEETGLGFHVTVREETFEIFELQKFGIYGRWNCLGSQICDNLFCVAVNCVEVVKLRTTICKELSRFIDKLCVFFLQLWSYPDFPQHLIYPNRWINFDVFQIAFKVTPVLSFVIFTA